MMNSTRHKRTSELFPTTCWVNVVSAGQREDPEHQAAFEDLCKSYWYPVYAFIRRRGFGSHEASDLAQNYFVRLMERNLMSKADEGKGRFRDLIRTDCGFFLADETDRNNAQKRGGHIKIVSMFDQGSAEARYLAEKKDLLTPDWIFNREWALALLDRVLNNVAHEYQETGRTELFEHLKPFLVPGAKTRTHREIGEILHSSEKAIEAAVRRMRKRYRDALTAEIASTLQSPDEESVTEELNFLFQSLRMPDPG